MSLQSVIIILLNIVSWYFDLIPAGYPRRVRVRVNPGFDFGQPVAVPVPPKRVRVIAGYGSGYSKKYPGVTRADHYRQC
jgi:hypothetical protein